MATFHEQGPQSQGAGALAVIAMLLLGALGANALLAGGLAFKVPATRPRPVQVAMVGGIATGLLVLFLLIG